MARLTAVPVIVLPEQRESLEQLVVSLNYGASPMNKSLDRVRP